MSQVGYNVKKQSYFRVAVIDSVAVLSTMNFQTYTRFKHALTLMATDKRIKGVGGHLVKVHGTVQKLVLIGNKEYDVTFIVMDSPENILLGADFLSTYNVKVDFWNATAHIG